MKDDQSDSSEVTVPEEGAEDRRAFSPGAPGETPTGDTGGRLPNVKLPSRELWWLTLEVLKLTVHLRWYGNMRWAGEVARNAG